MLHVDTCNIERSVNNSRQSGQLVGIKPCKEWFMGHGRLADPFGVGELVILWDDGFTSTSGPTPHHPFEGHCVRSGELERKALMKPKST